ncbi:bile acid:sodium symporter family protein [Parahaliea aestuarii]|uniref:Bile acid:sodium symporter family protein n=1 Tax=Parahaliea aestuarii TaxID=1852021 RepID=A0A5C8ZYM2_9GAMM|nr:bile acid:sodium symporter [Parahaliea aestuarii]TXS93596.1 bile acid:sodium symporter family protein [Parahaliea aestuarii]
MNIIDDIVLPGSLWCIMFSMGLSLTLGDFRRIFENRRALVLGVLGMLVIPPLVGFFFVTTFSPSPALAVGLMLLATCPGGMLSNLMTDLSKGDLALSLSLSVAVSAIYIFIVPIYAYFILHYFMDIEQAVDIPLGAFIWKIFSITLVPTSIGLAVRHYNKRLAESVRGYLKTIAVVVLTGAFIIILMDQVAILRDNFWTLFWIVLGMNLTILVLAFGLTRVSRLNQSETSAICIEHLIRQEGTALFIAVAIVGNREMSLPMIMNTPIGLVVCIILVVLLRKYMTGPAAATSGKAATS